MGNFGITSVDAEELVSDVLLAVVGKIHGFEFKKGDGDFHVWVMTIFRNRVRDFMRHRAATGLLTESFDEASPERDDELDGISMKVIRSIVESYEQAIAIDDRENLDTESLVQSRLRVISDTLEKMETWERVLLRCRALDVSYEEIAGYTGKPVHQLKVYHGRVKKKFARLLSEHYPELAHTPGVVIEHEA
jgi:RNA polymerase sigma factor (sigma-70 family)